MECLDGVYFEQLPDTVLFSSGADCRAFTVMGKQQGTADSRGLLWPRQLELFKAKQYKIIVLEKVKLRSCPFVT